MVVGCRHVVGVLEKLSHIGDNGLLIGGLDVNICSAESRKKNLESNDTDQQQKSIPSFIISISNQSLTEDSSRNAFW